MYSSYVTLCALGSSPINLVDNTLQQHVVPQYGSWTQKRLHFQKVRLAQLKKSNINATVPSLLLVW